MKNNDYIVNYNKTHFKTITIQFNPSVSDDDKKIYEYIRSKTNMNAYIKSLVVEDMKNSK